MSSKHSVMEDAKIKTRIIHSKAGVSTTDRTTVRTLIHFLPRSVARQRLIQLHLNNHIHIIQLYFKHLIKSNKQTNEQIIPNKWILNPEFWIL